MASEGLTIVSETQVRNTPSAVYNNLSCSGSLCCFAHLSDVVLVRPLGPQKLQMPDSAKASVSSAQLFTLADRTLLFVGTGVHVVVLDASNEAVVCKVSVETEVRVATPLKLGDRLLLLVGQSSGAVTVFHITPDFQTSVVSQLEDAHEGSVSAAASAADSPAAFVTGDNSGALKLWSGESLAPYLALPSVAPSTECVTSVAIAASNFVIAAYGSGKLRFFLPSTGELRIEIAAHSRWIQAMSLHHESMLLATTGDDQVVAVWQVPTQQNPRASLVALKQLRNSLSTGIAFNQDATGVIVATFDSDKLVTYGILPR